MTIRILKHFWQLPLALLALAEATIFFVSPYVAAAIRFHVAPTEAAEMLGGSLLPRAILYSCLLFTTLAAMGLYSARQRARFFGRMFRVMAGVVGGALLMAIAFYALPRLYFGRGVFLYAVFLSLSGSLLLRMLFDRIIDEDLFKRRVLVYGAGKRSSSLQTLRRRTDRRGFVVVGYIRAEGDDESVCSEDILPASTSLAAQCRDLLIDEIVVAMDDRRRGFPMVGLLECRLEGVEINDLSTFLERETGKVRLDVLHPSWMIFSQGARKGRLHSTLERIFDVMASMALLIVTWPLMIVAALAIKFEDGWSAPVLYGQARVGQHGRPFRLLKFRSMRENAEANGQAQWASRNDNRVTRVGEFIRKTRIDELPQIFNVLNGEMSFVGPRPERPEFVSRFIDTIPYYRERHVIKPGITGWAQICYPYGSSDKDAAEKLQYDLYYVKNHSLLFYVAVLVQTVEVILWRKGAR